MNDLVKNGGGGKDISAYDPDRGLKTIAVAEAAEQHWQRAKDATQLYEAVEVKLREQAEYVVWRDGVVVPSQQRGGPGRGKRVAMPPPVLPEGDPGKDTIKRWRKKFCFKDRDGTKVDHVKLKAALDETALRCQRVCEMESKGTERGTAGTGEFERYTPEVYIEAAREVMGSIDLDPASNEIAQQTVKATKYFTVKDDGLTKEWSGNVWLNPPYHRDLQPAFIDKMVIEVAAGHVAQAIMLTNNSTDTEWFLRAAQAATAICFTIGRVAFTTPSGEELAPTQGQTFFYFGKDVDRFAEVFRHIGFGVRLDFKYQAG